MTLSISSGNSLGADEIAKKTFPPARRGVEEEAVRRYLEAVAAEMHNLAEREQTLRRRLADAERRAAEPELDPATLTKAVGSETARILQTAHEAAAGVVDKAEHRAGELVTAAEEAANRRRAASEEAAAAAVSRAQREASELTAYAGSSAARMRESAGIEAVALTEAAQLEAVQLLDSAKAECRRMVREAREVRSSILRDLAERRRALYVQLEQLRSGRDSLVEMVGEVGEAVDDLRQRLAGAEHEARLAAADAGERAARLDDLAEATMTRASGATGELDLALTSDEAMTLEASAEEEAEVRARETEASHRSVDELFARIRAARAMDEAAATGGRATGEERAAGEEPVAKDVPQGSGAEGASASTGDTGAEEHLEPPVAGDEGPAEIVVQGEMPQPATEESAAGETEPETEESAAGETEHEGASAEEEDADAPEGSAEGSTEGSAEGSDKALLARRTELLSPVTVKLARALKRALQDDQNELLTALRNVSGRPDLSRLLPEDDQQSRYAVATTEALAEAWLLGSGWLRGGLHDAANDAQGPAELESAAASTLASSLAGQLSESLRHRVDETLGAVDDSGDGSAADAAGAAYREWKGRRVEALAEDFATRAFGWGAVAGAGGVTVRWIADDGGTPCSDCDDNVLAGEQPAGEPFPTGQVHPPVHPGCRCLIVLAGP